MKYNFIYFGALLVLVILAASCNKKSNSEEFTLEDSVFYPSSPITYSLDIDRDGEKDVALKFREDKWQSSQHDSFTVYPLHDGIQIAQKDSTFFVSKDSLKCPITATDSLTASVLKMCLPDAPNLYFSKKVSYAFVGKEITSSVLYRPFTTSLLIYEFDTYWSNNNPCHYTNSYNLFYGNGVDTKNFIYFMMKDQKYALMLSQKVPYITFHSIIKIS